MNQSTKPTRTRIKMCGLTRVEDVQTAVAAGCDAIGLVFYAQSPRYVELEVASKLIQHVPAFIEIVGLFVNAKIDQVIEFSKQLPLSLLQFHGNETPEYCESVSQTLNRRYIRALHIKEGENLLQSAALYPNAAAILLDTPSANYGGSGQTFDWSLLKKLPSSFLQPIILSGGLNSANVANAITQVRPYAVDVSSGIENAPGIKDKQKMFAFTKAVFNTNNQS